jgi:ankyrin repeat protein
VQLLVKFGGRIDIRDKSGETPLHKAAWRGSAECVQLLLQLGADPTARNADGKTPLDLCRVRDVRRLLVPPAPPGPDDEEADQEDPDSD